SQIPKTFPVLHMRGQLIWPTRAPDGLGGDTLPHLRQIQMLLERDDAHASPLLIWAPRAPAMTAPPAPSARQPKRRPARAGRSRASCAPPAGSARSAAA